jgi:hypothetical protein
MKKTRSSTTSNASTSTGQPQAAPSVPLVTSGGPPRRASKPRAARAGSSRAAGPSPDAIAARAYELFAARNWAHGHDLDDWLQAEAELASRPARTRRRAAGE